MFVLCRWSLVSLIFHLPNSRLFLHGMCSATGNLHYSVTAGHLQQNNIHSYFKNYGIRGNHLLPFYPPPCKITPRSTAKVTGIRYYLETCIDLIDNQMPWSKSKTRKYTGKIIVLSFLSQLLTLRLPSFFVTSATKGVWLSPQIFRVGFQDIVNYRVIQRLNTHCFQSKMVYLDVKHMTANRIYEFLNTVDQEIVL